MAGRATDPFAAYGRAQGSALGLRQADSMALARAANLLDDGLRQGSRVQLEDALKRNQRLWGQIERIVGPDGHPLPIKVRADLLSLARFVRRQTLKALISGAVADVRPLIDINREIAAGLAE